MKMMPTPFHEINSDPRVMETLGPLKTREEISKLIVRLQELQAKDGCCFWALETKADNQTDRLVRHDPGCA